jgi:hypothetical protein
MFLSVVDMDGCSMDVASGTACIMCSVQDLDVGAAVPAHSFGVMARHEELVAWRGLQDRHTPSRGRRPVVERRARDSSADGQSHGMYLANLIIRLWLRPGRSAHAGKVGQHFACREARRVSAVSGDLGVSPSIVIYHINDPGLSSK